eukprot:1207130-Pyramimonas_sp.AAC.1
MDTFLGGSKTYNESEKKVFYEYVQKHLAQKLPTDVAKHVLHCRCKKFKPKKNQDGATVAAVEKKGRLTSALSYDEPGREARSLRIQFLSSDKAKATQLVGPAPKGPPRARGGEAPGDLREGRWQAQGSGSGELRTKHNK